MSLRTCHVLIEKIGLAIRNGDFDDAAREIECRLKRSRETGQNIPASYESIHDDVDRMFEILVEGDFLREFVHFTVDAHAKIAVLANGVKDFGMRAFLSADNRRKDFHARPLREI